MAMKVTAARLHPHDELTRHYGEPLLLGGGHRRLAPYGGDLLVHVHPTDEAELEPLQVIDVAACGGQGTGPDTWKPRSQQQPQWP